MAEGPRGTASPDRDATAPGAVGPDPGVPGRTPDETADDAADHLHTLQGDQDELHRRLVRWLGARVESPQVSAFSFPTANGVSSDTLLFDAEWRAGGEVVRRRCVARLQPDPASSPVFPVYELDKQARIIRLAAERSTVPVPTILWEEHDPAAIGTPFFVMERVEGEVPPDIMPYPFGSWLSEASADDQRRLQDASVRVLADLHNMDVGPEEIAFLDYDGPGTTALRRHADHTADYYRWVAGHGARSPLLEEAFAWLEDHWPDDDGDAVVSWGDSRIGNMLFRDFEPVAVLDWEMAGRGPRELDLAWMVFLHRFLDDLALGAGMAGMPGFMRFDDAAAVYEAASGHTPRHLEFFGLYAATLMGVVIFREQQRPLLTSGSPLPDDPDSLVLHRDSLRAMLDGTYWERF